MKTTLAAYALILILAGAVACAFHSWLPLVVGIVQVAALAWNAGAYRLPPAE